jgi:hypothetical protein
VESESCNGDAETELRFRNSEARHERLNMHQLTDSKRDNKLKLSEYFASP